MSEKRRGLGRGLGALIPSAPAVTKAGGERPVDNVFFPGRGDDGRSAASEAGAATAVATKERPDQQASTDEPDPATSTGATQVGAPVARTGEPSPDRAGSNGATNGARVAVEGLAVVDGSPASIGGPAAPSGRSSAARAAGTARPEASSGPELVPVPGAEFAELPVESILPNPRQPRQVFDEEALAELVLSVREVGVLQPVVVRRIQDAAGEARFELIMGERRLRATRDAGLDRIPAIIRETSDDALLRDALLENLHRSQLNPLEEAAAYQQLLDDFGCTHEDLAGRIGRSRPQISNTLRLLRLPPLVQRRVAAGVLSAGHARALLGLEDPSTMERLAQRIVAEGLSVRAVEEIVALGDGPTARPVKRRPRAGSHTSELDDLASRLGDRLETRVAIALGKNRGRLTIDFASVEDLNRIVGVMSPQLKGAFQA